MDKIDKLVSDFLSTKFDEWKPYMTTAEQDVFALYYFKGYTIYQIAPEVGYCERHVKRLLKSARRKIYKLLP